MAGGLGSAFTTSVASLLAQSGAVSNAANNLANVTTPGFKRGVARIEAGATGIPAIFLSRDAAQAAIVPTGNPTDLAISGNGYFQVAGPNGTTSVTRSGSFGVSAAGVLVDHDGNAVVGPVALNPAGGTPSIAGNGAVTQGGAAAGQVTLATFANPAGLDAAGGNRLTASPASGPANPLQPGTGGAGTIVQGALEGSNVDPAQELVDMIAAKAAYRASISAIRTADSMLKDLLKRV
jgi:flagellar basal-body rod protein FlgG